MLLSIPLELLNKIYSNLDKSALIQLCLTCQHNYVQALPILYTHLELSSQTHIRHLCSSKEYNTELSRVLAVYTKTLTLKSRQNGNYWRAQDLIQLLGSNSPVDKLIFNGFQMLPMQNVHEIVAVLPNVTHIEFKYCHLVNQGKNRYISIYQSNIKNKSDSSVTTLSLLWTDFTAPAIDGILSYPKLDTIHLGANRNKYDRVNNQLVKNLHSHCPSIRNLTISLPLVTESTLSDTVRQYGNQLKHLSLRCNGPILIQTIADYCHQVEHLALHGGSDDGDDGSITHEPFLNMIRHCKSLNTLKLTSFIAQDIPNVFWKTLAHKDETRQKALDALEHISKSQKQREIYSNNTSIRSRNERNRIYHYAITEELLAQRYNYSQNDNQPLVYRTDLKLSFPCTLI